MIQERPNVLILGGASGGIGRMVFNNLHATNQYNLTATFFKHEQPGFDFCDIRDPESLKRVIGESKPKVILTFAGMAQEKLCQDNVEETIRTNVKGVENIVRQAEANGIPILYPSTINTLTGYTNGETCDEDIPPLAKPESIYGQSKIEAEKIVKSSSSLVWTIPRTDLVLGPDYGIVKLFKDNGFAKIMINGARFPIYIEHYSQYLQEFIKDPEKHTGIIHLFSPEFRNGFKLANLADTIIRRFNLAESTIMVPNATEFIPRANENSPMPIYILPDADIKATQRLLFTTKRH